MIIDSHVHTFPYMGGESGFPSAEEHLKRVQRILCSPANPPMRKRDHSPVNERTLWDGIDLSPAGLTQVGFRVAKFGRLEWTTDKEDLYLQYFAPSLIDNIATADYIVAEMDYAGVDVAVLQNHPVYGLLNDFFADCVRQYPKRYIALAHIREPRAHTDEQLSELHRCADALGHRGVFYDVGGFWDEGRVDDVDNPVYEPFWAELERLGLVLYWNRGYANSAEEYFDQLRRAHRVLQRHPSIPTVLAIGFPRGYCVRDGRFSLPEVAMEVGRLPGVLIEVAFPISCGRDWEYPYAEIRPLIHQLYDWFGPDKLVWGSDIPNVVRFCTYRQSYEYLRHCDFLSQAELDLVLGGNLARVFGLKPGNN